MTRRLVLCAVLAATAAGVASAQQAPPVPAGSARAEASIDVTGYWVSAITEDWRLRMITPPKGDYQNVPLNPTGVKLLQAWDPEVDRQSGAACKGYGAAAIMRMPTRIHVIWQDADILKFEFDHGTQTRLVHFAPVKPPEERAWQGHAVGEWIDTAGRKIVRREGRGRGAAAPQAQGGLRIVMTNLRPQYVRKNGAPVSDQAVVTDLIERIRGPRGDEWMIVKTIIQDPVYFTVDLVTSAQFKREPDGSKWNPTPCEVELPPTPRPAKEPPPR